jgi:hypothetical protein
MSLVLAIPVKYEEVEDEILNIYQYLLNNKRGEYQYCKVYGEDDPENKVIAEYFNSQTQYTMQLESCPMHDDCDRKYWMIRW